LAAVDVWWAAPSPDGEDLLVGVEVERARAYLRDADRERFVTGVALSRTVLAERLGVAPRDVPLDRTCADCGEPHGPPRLPDAAGLHLSIAHSGARVALAVAEVPVGIDVEKVDRKLDPARLGGRVLTPDEQASVHDSAGFLRLWTRKEALVKATGEGVSVLPRADPPEAAFADLDAGPGYVAAVAVLAEPGAVVRVRIRGRP
jgi:4'-phosphopantetheinyl transferase